MRVRPLSSENEKSLGPKQVAAAARRILKYAGSSYLPDELSLKEPADAGHQGDDAAGGDKSAPSGNGSKAKSRVVAEPLLPWAVKDAADYPTLPGDIEPNLRTLLELEQQLVRALRAGQEGAKELQKLDRWAADHLTDDSFWADDPWQTPRILPALHRLWTLLADHGEWHDRFRSVLKAAAHTLFSEGWLDPHRDGGTKVSRAMAAYWEQMVKDAGLTRLAKAAAEVWSSRKAAAPITKNLYGFQSDDAQFAVLRQNWSPRGLVLAVDYSGPECGIVLDILGRRVFCGDLRTVVTIDGTENRVTGDWESVCWFSDSEAEYLELQCTTEEGWQLNRQFFLARSAELLLFADTLILPEKQSFELQWTIPSMTGTGLKGVLPTRAQDLQGMDFPVRVLPIGLPSNPMEPTTSRIQWADGLQWQTRAETDCLCIPVGFAWSRKELSPHDYWRSLTITNDRRLVSPDEAVAFRIPHANKQIIFYRSHRGVHRYAFVGAQTFAECLIGTIGSDGELTEWVTVEPDSQ